MTTYADTPEQATEQAGEHLLDVLNHGALALMVSVGHRTGLFAALADAGPVDSPGLARAAGLQERYVREWLGAMTVGRLVQHDPDGPDGPTYSLTPAYAAWLVDGGEFNLAASAQFLPVLASVEDQVVACFREGGGVPYDAFPRFQEVMETESAQTVIAALEDAILPLVPGLTERLETGIDVLDVGCGRGRALQHLAERFPTSRFTGLDLSPDAVAHATATSGHLPGLGFVVGDATDLATRWPEPGFDLVTTFDAVHDQGHPAQVLAGIRAVLRPGGTYLAQDIDTSGSHAGDLDHPLGTFLYTISCLHCMTVSLAQGGDGLGAAWGRPMAERMLHEAGFARVEARTLPHDEQNVYYVCS